MYSADLSVLLIRCRDEYDALMYVIRWRFAETLARDGISVYSLKKILGERVARSTLYRWASIQAAPIYIDFEVLCAVLDGLTQITGKLYSTDDIFQINSSPEHGVIQQ
jgi:hypothetical protein